MATLANTIKTLDEKYDEGQEIKFETDLEQGDWPEKLLGSPQIGTAAPSVSVMEYIRLWTSAENYMRSSSFLRTPQCILHAYTQGALKTNMRTFDFQRCSRATSTEMKLRTATWIVHLALENIVVSTMLPAGTPKSSLRSGPQCPLAPRRPQCRRARLRSHRKR